MKRLWKAVSVRLDANYTSDAASFECRYGELDPALAARRALAETILASIVQRPGGRAKARLIDLACAQQHRVAEVFRSPHGPIYSAKLMQYERYGDRGSPGQRVSAYRNHRLISYVDVLVGPTSLLYSNMQVPGHCRCGDYAPWLDFILVEVERAYGLGRSTRLVIGKAGAPIP